MRTALFAAVFLSAGTALAQTTTLQSDDNAMDQLWSLTSPNAGPGDWVAVGYTPPIEFPFRVVNASMHYLDRFCCSGSSCSTVFCVGGADFDRRVIARQNLAVDSAGLTPDLSNVIASQTNIPMDAGATATQPPWSFTPNIWDFSSGTTVFDSPGRIFYAVKWFDGDEWMRFAVDDDSNLGTSFYTTDNFTTRSAIWSFGNVGMRITIEPLFNLKLAANLPAASYQLASTQRVVMLALRAGAGNAATAITRVRVSASGTGNDQTGISAVRLVVDADRDGLEGAGEATIATGTFAANNGTVDLNFNRTLARGSSEQWLVVYDFSSAPLGGDTFTARIAVSTDVSSGLGAPYMSGTVNGTGALSGNAVTIAGRLSASRGPNSMASRVVSAGTNGLSTLQVRLTAENEAFTVSALTVTADGTLNDVTNVSSVRLYHDADSNGVFSGGDSLLRTESFTLDNGRVTFNLSPAFSVPANASRDLIVALDLSANAVGGETVRTIVGSAADLGAAGATSGALPLTGPRALTGPPIIGNIATIGGALAASLGAATPIAGTGQPSSSDVPMLQINLQAQSENVAVNALTFSGSGSGDEAAHISRVRLYRDTNANGLRDAGDAAIGLPQSYAADNGVVTFALGPEVINAGQSRAYLLTYDFNAVPVGGETFSVRLNAAADLIAEGQASGAPITAGGAFPLNGAQRTLLGGLSIALGPENPAANNVQPGVLDVPVLQLRAQAQGEAFTVTALRITASGTLDELNGTVRAELWRDNATYGVRDAGDVLLGTAVFSGDDGTALFNFNTVLAAGANERWLLTYDLSALPTPGQTFRASVALAAHVTAGGSLSGNVAPNGLPLTGATHGIGGAITLSLGPGNPLGGSIPATAAGVVMAQLRLTAALEPITVSSIILTASGTGNDLTAISGVRLWVDADQDGVLDAVGDLPLGAATTFPMDDGRATLSFTPRTLAAGAREDLLVVYDLNGAAGAGDTFVVSITNGADVSATAPSGVVPRAGGTPISSNTRSVLGELAISAGANNPPARTVRRDATALPLLQLRVAAIAESFSVASLRFNLLGSVDDVADVSGFTLYDDLDASGTITPGDAVIAGPVAAGGDDGELRFAVPFNVARGTARTLLVTAGLSGNALGGSTLRLSLANAADVIATGFSNRSASATGLPISSNTLTTGGTLEVGLGVASPLARVIQRGSSGVDAMQLRFVAATEPVTITQLVLHARGTGDDASAIADVSLYLDGDADGRLDPGELQLGSATFAANNGTAIFALNRAVQVGPALHVLARVGFTQTPIGGDTFELFLDPSSDVSITAASNAVAIVGSPSSGAVLTAGGGFEIARGAQSSPSIAVNQSTQGAPLLQLDLRSVNESCTVHALTLRASGSIDDRLDVSAVRLLYDANDNGLSDFTDVALAPAATFALDDGTVSFTNLNRTFGRDASQRWLVAYDLSGSASNLETLAIRLDRESDLVVSCDISGPVTVLGTPVESEVFTVQEDGALIVSRSARTAPPAFLAAGTVRAPVLALRLAADVQDLEVRELALSVVAASGAPADTVARVELFRDVNQDGVLDRSDPQLGSSAVDALGKAVFAPIALGVSTVEVVYVLATVSVASNAVPGRAFTVSLASNAELAAFSALGPALTTGAPISGESMTVAGNLNLSAATPPVPAAISNDAASVTVLDLALASVSEAFTLRALTVTADGSMEPSADVSRLSLIADADGDGVPSAADRVLGAGVAFAQGAKRASFAGMSERIDPAAAVRLFVVADFAGTARIDRTIRFSIAANVDVLAEGERVGLTSPVGAPVFGPDLSIGPSLRVALGPVPPPSSIVAANAENVVALHLAMSAVNEDVLVSRLSLRAAGTLDDGTGIAAVRLLLDNGADGRVDPGDVEIAAARPAGDDGAITFSPLAERITRGTTSTYLLTVDLSGSGSAGQNVTVSLESDGDVTAFGSISGAIAAVGAPVAGAELALVGALNVRLGSGSPAGIGVRPGEKFAALQVELFTRGEIVRVERVQLALEGTADDGAAITRAILWRDLDGDGAVSDADLEVGAAQPSGDDGPLVFDNVALSIMSDASELLLLELELDAGAAPGGTIRSALLANADVRATGAVSGPVNAIGAPISGSAFTIVRADPVGGGGGGQVSEGCGCSAASSSPSSSSAVWKSFLLLGIGLIFRAGRFGRRG